jgi:anti-sigma28 factor (negative regulator of flagellin synthesis)
LRRPVSGKAPAELPLGREKVLKSSHPLPIFLITKVTRGDPMRTNKAHHLQLIDISLPHDGTSCAEMRRQKVAALRKSLQTGTYSVAPEKIAAAMLREIKIQTTPAKKRKALVS